MDYKKLYERLITSRKARPVSKEVFYEKHHILPRSMGGSNDVSNLVHLTPREHFIAHKLLWLIHRNQQMAYAIFCMGMRRADGYKISAREYEKAKIPRREISRDLHMVKDVWDKWDKTQTINPRKIEPKFKRIYEQIMKRAKRHPLTFEEALYAQMYEEDERI